MSGTIELLYQHDDFIVVNKPIGLAMHGDEDAIIQQAQTTFNLPKLYLVHRLDTPTSGCLVLARSNEAAAYFGELFATRTIQKYYIAVTQGSPKKKQGTIIGDMKNRRGGQHILLKSKDNPAITQFFSRSLQPGFRGIMVKPHTGKTHQIRVALKSLGSPILGDTLYGATGADRMYLHAYRLDFRYQGEVISICALPTQGELFQGANFDNWLVEFAHPEQLNWPSVPGPKQAQL